MCHIVHGVARVRHNLSSKPPLDAEAEAPILWPPDGNELALCIRWPNVLELQLQHHSFQ